MGDVVGFLVVVGFVLFVVLLVTVWGNRREPVQPQQCRACGTAHPAFARFCRRCGKKLT